jgi:hypothetical protein
MNTAADVLDPIHVALAPVNVHFPAFLAAFSPSVIRHGADSVSRTMPEAFICCPILLRSQVPFSLTRRNVGSTTARPLAVAFDVSRRMCRYGVLVQDLAGFPRTG